jgi:hypothetical protein
MPFSPDHDHAAAGRIGSCVTLSRHAPAALTASARLASRSKLDAALLADIDRRAPGLPEAERQRRLQWSRKAHFRRMAARRTKKTKVA